MKNKKNGFILIEVIISLSLICLVAYMISYSLYENYNGTENNRKRIEMLNTAKQFLECTKNEIKNSKNFVDDDSEETKDIGEYKVAQKIEKYYQCYKINIEVKNEKESVKLYSYVLEQ